MYRVMALVVALVGAGCDVPDKHFADAGGGDDVMSDGGAELDTVPPETTIDAAPAALSNDATPELGFSSNEPGTFVCTIDGGALEPCTTPFAPTLADGPHTFTVAAIDDAGNQDPTPAEHLWTMDTVAPETSITSGPPAIDNSTSVIFELASDTGDATFECDVDGGGFAACTSPHAVTAADGAHSFEVRATDLAGNVDATPATTAWTTDLSTPDTVINSGPTGMVSSAAASFTFSSPDAGGGATFQCSLDNAAFTTCTSPQAYAGLTQAAHNFRVRVRDAGGNLDPSPASRDWTVDTTAPTTTIVTGPTGTVASTSATFTFSSNEAGTFQCRTDGGSFATCPTPYQPTMFTQGAHMLDVRARDAAGNLDATPATRTWTVDTVGPTVTITSGPTAGGTTGPYVTFAFTTSEGSLLCSMDGAAYAACTSPRSYSLNDASHTFSVRASDAVGNLTTVSRTWNVDCAGQTTGPGGLYLFPMNESSGQVVDNILTTVAEGTLGGSSAVEPTDPQRITAGRFSRALNFIANERDLMFGVNHVGASHDHTIEAWVRPSTSTATNTVVDVGPITVWFTSTAAGVRFNYQITTATGASATASSGGMPAAIWYYVVATYTGTTMRLYVNGAQAGTATLSTTSTFPMDRVELSPFGASVQGDIDEVFVGTTAFLATDVLTRYCPL